MSRIKDLSKWLSSKLYKDAKIGRTQSESQVKEEGQQKDSKERGSVACHHSFGFLRKLPKGAPIPDECLVCPEVIHCMNRRSN